MILGEVDKVKNVSAETKNAIVRKSAQSLPTNPSERGYSAEEIKRRFYQPILDAANSALSEIDRVVNEFNNSMGQMEHNFNWLVEMSLIKEPYKLTLNQDTWVFNEQSGLYEITIPASEHGFENYDEIGVDMFLLDGQGKFTHVNQFEVKSDASVRVFHENNGAGHISIYIKREGYISSKEVIDAENVLGLSKVGKTNNFEDLDNKPNLNIMYSNEEILAKIINGGQAVNKAVDADKATNADYSSTSGASDYSSKAEYADRAKKDANGAEIPQVYAKQNGSYDDLTAGKSGLASRAQADEDGVNIKNRYAKQDGTYPSMSVGKSTNADKATKADESTKAVNDGSGNNIENTYAKKNGTYSGMSVGNSTNATNADKAIVKSDGTHIGFTEDANGVLKAGDVVVSKKKVLWTGSISSTSSGGSSSVTLSEKISSGDRIKIVYELYRSRKREVTFIYQSSYPIIFFCDVYNGIATVCQCEVKVGGTTASVGQVYYWNSKSLSLSLDATIYEISKVIE